MTSGDLRSHLEAIREQHGHLTPEAVVESARPVDHPLHTHVFDRPPSEAAEAWYRGRAHDLIVRARVVYKPDSGDSLRSVRAFHAVRTEHGHVYEPAEKVASDPFLRELVLRDMEREWRQLHERYGHFAEFVTLVTHDVLEAAA